MARMESQLANIARKVGPAAKRALFRTAEDVFDISQQLVPVDEGKLKASGGIEVVSDKHVQVGYGREGSEREDVAIFQEYGTANSPAQPYLTPAFEQNVETFKKRLADEMEKLT